MGTYHLRIQETLDGACGRITSEKNNITMLEELFMERSLIMIISPLQYFNYND